MQVASASRLMPATVRNSRFCIPPLLSRYCKTSSAQADSTLKSFLQVYASGLQPDVARCRQELHTGWSIRLFLPKARRSASCLIERFWRGRSQGGATNTQTHSRSIRLQEGLPKMDGSALATTASIECRWPTLLFLPGTSNFHHQN